VGELLKNKSEFSKLASDLKVDETTLRNILSDQKYKNENLKSVLVGNIKDKLKENFKKASKGELKKLIDTNVLSKNITLLQLDDDTKNQIKAFFKQV